MTSVIQSVRDDRPLWAAVALLSAGTVALLAASNHAASALVLPLGATACWAIWKSPLRATLLVACFLMLALEGEGDASGKWQSPLYTAGMLLHSNLNVTLPVKALRFSGFDVLAVGLAALAVARGLRDETIDRDGRVPASRAAAMGALLTAAGIAVCLAWGIVRGGSAQQMLWQTHQLAFIPLLFFLFAAALRGRADHAVLAKLIVGAALIKAALACWVRWGLHFGKTEVPTATSHQDSLLFAVACAILLAQLWESPRRESLRTVFYCAPLLLAGMVANNRRLVWVEVLTLVALLWAMSPRSRTKKRVATALIAILPLALAYTGLGWRSSRSIFKPVQTIRSVVDSKTDRSSETRDVENYNLLVTFRTSPLFGLGFGHQYIERVKGDDISAIFAQYRYIPHNSVLGLWAFGGMIGFFLLFGCVTAGAYLAARSYRHAADPMDRAAAFVCIAALQTWVLQAYGDMGVISWHGAIVVAGALAVASKLAVSTGAWRAAWTS